MNAPTTSASSDFIAIVSSSLPRPKRADAPAYAGMPQRRRPVRGSQFLEINSTFYVRYSADLLDFDDGPRTEPQAPVAAPAAQLRAQARERLPLARVDALVPEPVADGQLEVAHAEARLEREE